RRTGRTDLPSSLRRGMVHRRTLGRFFVERIDQAGGAFGQGKICAVHLDPRYDANAGPKATDPGLALYRRVADGSGDAPADITLLRNVRRKLAEPGRRADSAAGAVEVRVQERKGQCAD